MKNIATTIAYASAWIATAIAIIFAIKYTGSALGVSVSCLY